MSISALPSYVITTCLQVRLIYLTHGLPEGSVWPHSFLCPQDLEDKGIYIIEKNTSIYSFIIGAKTSNNTQNGMECI